MLARTFDVTSLSPGAFTFRVLRATGPAEGLGLLCKTLLPGLAMGAICCARGYAVTGPSAELAIAAVIRRGFAEGVTAVTLINAAISVLVYF